jgi:hypothetical protein
MSHRTVELAQREATLRLHCALQRGDLGRQVDGIQARLQSVDRVVATARRIVVRPAVIVGVVLVLLVLGRARSFRVLRRGLTVLGAVRGVARLTRI